MAQERSGIVVGLNKGHVGLPRSLFDVKKESESSEEVERISLMVKNILRMEETEGEIYFHDRGHARGGFERRHADGNGEDEIFI
jgi:hypothetical protein